MSINKKHPFKILKHTIKKADIIRKKIIDKIKEKPAKTQENHQNIIPNLQKAATNIEKIYLIDPYVSNCELNDHLDFVEYDFIKKKNENSLDNRNRYCSSYIGCVDYEYSDQRSEELDLNSSFFLNLLDENNFTIYKEQKRLPSPSDKEIINYIDSLDF